MSPETDATPPLDPTGDGSDDGPGNRVEVPITPEIVGPPSPGVVDLVLRSARLGVDAATLMAGEMANFSLRVARAVLPPAVADGPLDAVDERLTRHRAAAQARGERSIEETRAAAEAVLNQVVVGVVDMLDMETVIDHVPLDKVVARIDVPGIIDEIDLGDIVRESTTGLVGETVDAIRVQVMGLDLFVARVVDTVLRRKQPRERALPGYDVFGPEARVPKDLR